MYYIIVFRFPCCFCWIFNCPFAFAPPARAGGIFARRGSGFPRGERAKFLRGVQKSGKRSLHSRRPAHFCAKTAYFARFSAPQRGGVHGKTAGVFSLLCRFTAVFCCSIFSFHKKNPAVAGFLIVYSIPVYQREERPRSAAAGRAEKPCRGARPAAEWS